MRRPAFLATLTLLLQTLSAGAGDKPSSTIHLGGTRRVEATIRLAGTDYMISVQMKPVRCFSSATNANVNREKGRTFALQALARHLNREKRQEATRFLVQHISLENAKTTDDGYRLDVRIPVHAVRPSPTGEHEEDGLESRPRGSPLEGAFAGNDAAAWAVDSSGLLTRKRDYLATAGQLGELHTRSLQCSVDAQDASIAHASKGKAALTPHERRGFYAAIADHEERIVGDFGQLKSECEQDPLLLSVEKAELIVAFDRSVDQVLEGLRRAVEDFEAVQQRTTPP